MKRLLVLSIALILLGLPGAQALAADQITCWFPPSWQSKTEKAQAITDALSSKSGISIQPRIAESYPEILSAFAAEEQNLVYVGSFVQAIINARGLGNALVQSQDGKELYSGILIHPEGADPQTILQQSPEQIAFAVGASSGESTAKAATGGKASVPTANHGASCQAIREGKAKAAVVKNWWWQANQDKYPGLVAYEIPSYSRKGNPDNVLTASKAVSKDVRDKLVVAAMQSSDVFGAQKIQLFDNSQLGFSLWLMEQGKIDPQTHSW